MVTVGLGVNNLGPTLYKDLQMKVKFNKPRAFNGVDYKVGIHDIPDAMHDHWYLLAAIANGHAAVLEAPKKPAPKVEKQVELAEEIVASLDVEEPKQAEPIEPVGKPKKKSKPKKEASTLKDE